MGRYAKNTRVSVERSRDELEKLLDRYGADQFIYGRDDDAGVYVIGFRFRRLSVRFNLELPNPESHEFTRTATGLDRSPSEAEKAWKRGIRQRWRALVMITKAKLEAVESGITTFEEEFLANLVLRDGRTAGQHLLPQIAQGIETGQMPKALPLFD